MKFNCSTSHALAIVIVLGMSSHALLGAGANDSSPTKLPVPDEAAQKESMSIVKDVYKTDYDKAKTPNQKLELAKKLLNEGKHTEDDISGKFVLLKVAKELATQAGDVSVALEAVDSITAAFDVDPLEFKTEAFVKLAKVPAAPTVQKELFEAIDSTIDLAVNLDKYESARQLAGLATTVAKNSKDAPLLKQAVARSKEIEQNAAAFTDTQRALKVLDAKPTDSEANLIVGKFRCFNARDWEHGLPLLALGSDAILKGLAEKELLAPISPTEQATLGDGWWAVAERETGLTKGAVQARASYWYEKALPGLSGLLKAKIEKRLAEVSPPSRDKPSGKSATIDLIALAKKRAGSESEKWEITNDGVVLGKANYSDLGVFDFGYVPPTEFNLRLTLTKTGDATMSRATDFIYLLTSNLGRKASFVITNSGDRLLQNVRLEATVPMDCVFCEEDEMPQAPERYVSAITSLVRSQSFSRFRPKETNPGDVEITALPDRHQIEVRFGNIQAKASVFSDVFFAGSRDSQQTSLTCRLYADELTNPETVELLIEFETEQGAMTFDELQQYPPDRVLVDMDSEEIVDDQARIFEIKDELSGEV